MTDKVPRHCLFFVIAQVPCKESPAGAGLGQRDWGNVGHPNCHRGQRTTRALHPSSLESVRDRTNEAGGWEGRSQSPADEKESAPSAWVDDGAFRVGPVRVNSPGKMMLGVGINSICSILYTRALRP